MANHIVKQGDTLWGIARANNTTVANLRKLNPKYANTDIIRIGDNINLTPQYTTNEVDIRQERKREERYNLDNVSAIQAYNHDSNYVIVDKKGRNLTIYDKNNKPLYSTNKIATGLSGDDYNTVTYTKEGGGIENFLGNNSTPAGISEISGVGEYHGVPTFIRSRTLGDGTKENIASSMHYGNIGQERNASNGCIRIAPNQLLEMSKYIGEGTRVYTLPEKEGSRFSIKGGKLNFTADNSYGKDAAPYQQERKELKKALKDGKITPEVYNTKIENLRNRERADKVYWDDYNVNIDKSYSPLKITWNKTGNEEYDSNVRTFAKSLVYNKRNLQKQLNLSSDEYNRLAELALGIAEQETKFGTSRSYKSKLNLKHIKTISGANSSNPEITDIDIRGIVNPIGRAVRQIASGKMPHNLFSPSSEGYGQIKIEGDNAQAKAIYKKLGIDSNSIDNADKSALAILARLAIMYNNEIKGRTFKGAKGNIDQYDALLYKWNGKNHELKNKTATPEANKYIRQVKQYANRFKMYDIRKTLKQ